MEVFVGRHLVLFFISIIFSSGVQFPSGNKTSRFIQVTIRSYLLVVLAKMCEVISEVILRRDIGQIKTFLVKTKKSYAAFLSEE
jgi:hypothetical protein